MLPGPPTRPLTPKVLLMSLVLLMGRLMPPGPLTLPGRSSVLSSRRMRPARQ
jgi:hypothetical protein